MTHILLPAIWLIVLIVGLPQLSETVYTPSLPDIAHALRSSEAMIEYTLTIYLFGFALGTLFWGKISDKLGRKPCMIAGLLLFVIACIGCYFSNSIEMLMISRLIQAFGGATGSVLGQAICRDAFHGPALGRVYSITGSAIALFPALGPLCGGLIAEIFGWRNIFVFLTMFALIVTILVSVKLPETHPHASRKKVSAWNIATQLMLDKKVIGFGLIVAGCNGILFSYFAEGSFYLIKGLGLSPSHYGLSFTVIGASAMLGGIVSRRLQNKHSSKEIMGYGLLIIAFATTIFSWIAIINHNLFGLPSHIMIAITIMSQAICIFGTCIASVNALALALVDYKHAIGTASSLFGFFYYCMISLFTFFMGFLHDGTLLPMPLYFLALSCFMMIVNRICLKS
jgi:DHA1 family bicyclomycin/chloramphenicol resistance-like MFS transporter